MEKLQRLFEPEGCSKQGKQVGGGGAEDRKATNANAVDPSKPCEYREGTRHEHHK